MQRKDYQNTIKQKLYKKLRQFISEKITTAIDMIFKVIFWIDVVNNWGRKVKKETRYVVNESW